MAARKAQLATQVVGNVGLYYACYRLSLLGWNVMPTARNARGIDALCYDETATRTLTIQVKALSKRSPVPLGTSNNHELARFMIVVVGATLEEHPKCYVLSSDEVTRLAHTSDPAKSRDGKAQRWLQQAQYESEQFKERWDRLVPERGLQETSFASRS